jgi:hypothetical protein
MKKQFIDLFLLSLLCFMALSLLVRAETLPFDEPPPDEAPPDEPPPFLFEDEPPPSLFFPPLLYDDFEKQTILDENGEPITGVKKEGFEKGENYVMENPYIYGLYTSDDVETRFYEGIYECLINPQYYEGLVDNKPSSAGLSITDDNKDPDDHDVTHYYAGDTIDIRVYVPIDRPYYKQVDLWVIIELSTGGFLYRNDDMLNPFVLEPIPFMKSIHQVEKTYQILHYPVSSDIKGNYIIYVFFNKEKSGLEHLFRTIKSNTAVFRFTISDF